MVNEAGSEQGAVPDGQQIELSASTRNDFVFTGTGGEYFRIWIVNLLLSIITLGIYSAWAKVRREQYFHRNTLLADSAFEYHGNPISILKGRLLIVGLLGVYQILGGLIPVLALVMAVVFLLTMPWIVCQALRFRTWNTSWRGVRFGFSGTYGGIAKVYFWNGLLVIVTLGFAAPWWLNRFQRYIVSNVHFGDEQFDSNAPVFDYYKPMFVLLAFVVVVGAVVATIVSASGWKPGSYPSPAVMISLGIAAGVFYIGLLLIGSSYVRATLANTLWNHTGVGEHQFESSYRTMQLLALMVTNALAVVFTLGLFAPVAKVRMARYRAETLALNSTGSLDAFVAHQEEQSRAIGDQAAELMDIDLGF